MNRWIACALIAVALPAAADNCRRDCGRVMEVERYVKKGEGSGVGMVAGGVAGALIGNQIGKGDGRKVATVAGAAGGAYVGNEIEKNSKSINMLRVVVKMDEGGTRTFNVKDQGQFRDGDRVHLVDGKLKRFNN